MQYEIESTLEEALREDTEYLIETGDSEGSGIKAILMFSKGSSRWIFVELEPVIISLLTSRKEDALEFFGNYLGENDRVVCRPAGVTLHLSIHLQKVLNDPALSKN